MTYNMSRLRFFNGQFLVEDDFTDQEQFHIDQRELQGRTLHVWGVTQGLSVTQKAGDPTTLIISEGAAVDGAGHQILLDVPREVQPPVAATNQTYSVVITFKEDPTDPAPPQYAPGFTRLTQNPVISFETNVDPGQVLLAEVTVDTAGHVTGLTATNRTYAGARLPGREGKGFTLRSVPEGELSSKLSVDRYSAGDVDFEPLVTVTAPGLVGIGQPSPAQKLVVWDGLVGFGYNDPDQTAALAVGGSVGIGTTTPGAMLEVAGQVKITGGAPAAERALVSDAQGLGSWSLIGTGSLANGAVTTDKLASLAVTTGKLADGNVTTPKIADDNVTTAKIANLNVTTPKLSDGAVDANKLAANSVTTPKLVDGTVTPPKIQAGGNGQVLATTSGAVGWTYRTHSILISASHFNANSFYGNATFGAIDGYETTFLSFPGSGSFATASLFLPPVLDHVEYVSVTFYYSLSAAGAQATGTLHAGGIALGTVPFGASGGSFVLPASSTAGGLMAADASVFFITPGTGMTQLLIQRQDTDPAELRLYAVRLTYML